jgi:3-keto-5-aminohexanoate cleavage enzyme
MMSRMIIEARINEITKRTANPNIPYTAEEIITDVLACAEAGASIVHFHARTPEGGESNDPAIYREVITAVRAKSDVLIHTTLGQFDSTDAALRTAHVAELARTGAKPDIAPLDMGSFNVDIFDPKTRDFVSGSSFIYTNPTDNLRGMAEQLRGFGIKPQAVPWSVPSGRLMQAFLDAGLLETPAFAGFILTGETILAAHPTSLKGIQAYVDLCTDNRVEWSMMSYCANLLPFVPDIARMGGHVSIGLGDYPYPELGEPTNADVIRAVVEATRGTGRKVATAAETREILRI